MRPERPAIATLGEPRTRVDGPDKVCGATRFAGDVRLSGMAHAVLVTSPIARGRIAAIDTDRALAAQGILDVLTYRNVGNRVRSVDHLMAGGWANSSHRPLGSADIRYAGQIVAVVVADSFEAAQDAAHQVRVGYEAEAVVADLDAPGADALPLHELREGFTDRVKGSVEAELAQAAATVCERYSTPVQHHNPIELPSTTCVWDGDRLTVHEPTRFVGAVQHGLAAQLGIDPSHVRVVSRFIGGHFGSKLALSQHTVLAALAAWRVKRPVRLAVGRRDNFTVANHRTETRHAIRLGADRDGRLTVLAHVATTATSRFDTFAMPGTDVTTALYACPNISSEERLARVDRNTPGPMRAPPEVPYMFALESAVDELAHALRLDPIEFRRRNDTRRDPVTGHPFTSRRLMPCFDAGAAAFGWEKGPREPRSRREGAWWVGDGCAAAARPVKIGPACMRVSRLEDGGVLVETAQHEIGNGLYTLLAMTASERLGVPFDRVAVRLGDSDLPPGGLSGGSSTTTSLVNALALACAELRADAGRTRAEVEFAPPGADPDAIAKLKNGHMALVGPPDGKLSWAFGAHFVEARVHAATGEVRLARHVGAFAVGRVLNPLATDSQLVGGMIWGQGSALLEATAIDRRTGAYVNRDLAEYHVATGADVPPVTTAITIADEDTQTNAEGLKGLGEIGIIGVNAAIANAVFAATGRRVRDLPIRVEALI